MNVAGSLLEIGLKSTAIVLLCGAVSIFLRRRSAIWENRIWRVCLIGVALTPIWTLANFLIPPVAPVSFVETQKVRLGVTQSIPRLNLAVEARPEILAPVFDSDRPVQIGYAFGAFVFLAWLVLGLIRIRRIVKRSTTFGEQGLLITDEIAAPATVGAWKTVILLPSEARHWDRDSLGAAVLHERTHIRRHDWTWQIAGQIVRALFWFNPFAWVLTAVLRQSGERACDDQVVQSGYQAATYAKQLLSIVSQGSSTPETVVAIVRKGGLKGRLKRILAPGYPFRPAGKPIGIGLSVLVGAGSIALGSVAIAISQKIARKPVTSFYGPLKLKGGQWVSAASVRPDVGIVPGWAPDGGPDIDNFGEMEGPGKPILDKRSLGIHVRAGGRLFGDAVFPKLPGWEAFTASRSMYSDGQDIVLHIVPDPAVKQIDIKAGFPTEPYKVCEDCAPGQAPLYPRLAMNAQHGDSRWVGLEVQFEIPAGLRHRQLRMEVVTKSGKTIYDDDADLTGLPGRNLTYVDDQPPVRWFHFPTLKPSDVSRVRLMAHKIEWVTFRGIHVQSPYKS